MPPRRLRPPTGRRAAALVAATTVLGLAHAAAVWGRYHVGSFDDDSAYLYMATALAHGTGLAGRLPDGWPLLRDYPPGYPALLAPLVALFGSGHGWVPERLLSLCADAAVFPLTWRWLRGRVDEVAAAGVLVLLAVNPVLATWASMTTPELVYVVSFLFLLLAAEKWQHSPRLLSPSGAAAILLAAGGVWLKEAGLGVAAGLVLWCCWQRRWGRAIVSAGAVAALLVPILVARAATGVALAGSRYTGEINGYIAGGLLHKLALIPVGLGQLLFYALFEGVTPVFSPWDRSFVAMVLVSAVASVAALAFVAAGARRWIRERGGDAAVWLVAAYLLEVVAYRYVNERRIVLILPVVTAWWVLGARLAGRWWVRRAPNAAGARLGANRRRAAVAASATFAAVVLGAQFGSDYLVRAGSGSTSEPAGSRYERLLAALGPPGSVVESDFEWTTALYSGHPAAMSAFTPTYTSCAPAAARAALAGLVADRAAYGYTAQFNAEFVDDGCLAHLALTEPWAVPLLQTRRDHATVFEVVGPGTVHPALRGLAVVLSASSAGPSIQRALPAGSVVTQVSLGAATGPAGTTRSVTVQLDVHGRWLTVAAAPGPVGGGRTPWLLARLPAGVPAAAVRVTVAGTGVGGVRLSDLAVVGR